MQINLQGKVALVCGSTSGIGLAIAQQFALSGATVICLARNVEKLKQVIANLPGSHFFYEADFANNKNVEQVIQQIITKHTIHILVNNTGGPPAGAANTANVAEFTSAFNLHLINNHILAQAVIPSMKNNNFGRIINIISTSVKIPLPNLGVSNTIRGAVGNWSKTLANELGPFGITVNNILPGATATDRLSNIITGKSTKLALNYEEVEKEMLAEIPAGRFGLPQEPAYAATFLASDFAAYINGTNVVVDGGRTGNL